MKMSEIQAEFTSNIGKLIQFADELGYGLTFGDAFRDPRVHGDQGTKAAPYGEAWSAHKYRLAVDFNLFIEGEWQASTEAFRELGEYWETLNESNVWGGHFNDGNHFSRRYNSVA